jgi:hypothetical protein
MNENNDDNKTFDNLNSTKTHKNFNLTNISIPNLNTKLVKSLNKKKKNYENLKNKHNSRSCSNNKKNENFFYNICHY